MNKILNINNYEKVFVEDDSLSFEGYLAKYDNVDRVGDIIKKGAFKEAIKNKPSYTLRYNHITMDAWDADADKAIDNIIGSFRAEDRADGVYVYGTLFPEYGKVYALMKSGALSEMSIGFIVEDAEALKEGSGLLFKKCLIREGSIVDVPANSEAIITVVKSMSDRNIAIKPAAPEVLASEEQKQLLKESLQDYKLRESRI